MGTAMALCSGDIGARLELDVSTFCTILRQANLCARDLADAGHAGKADEADSALGLKARRSRMLCNLRDHRD